MALQIVVARVELTPQDVLPKRYRFVKDERRIFNGRPETGQQESFGRSEMVSLIRDTPEHRAALEQFRAGMAAILEKLQVVFAPENVEKALKGHVPLLPGIKQ